MWGLDMPMNVPKVERLAGMLTAHLRRQVVVEPTRSRSTYADFERRGMLLGSLAPTQRLILPVKLGNSFARVLDDHAVSILRGVHHLLFRQIVER
jgi:hypothetical protein